MTTKKHAKAGTIEKVEGKTKRGGKRPGSGRKKGTPNKKTAAVIEAIQKTGLTPLAYMLKAMRDSKLEPSRRDDMAKAAAPYVHPRLAAIEHSGDVKASVIIVASSTDQRI